ncbi:PBP1A family penicillin-binding protein [Vagococcus coleopterorum]|uniref:PBP1A family penicillin-binding protein n=1 Tax=Vagococcus coleopterorum TaxID=2714946 RepID=A0A6G8AL39_9ENTE|nr:PBP1A family penicillin-binding protein [Vagococcus coleopterorum]QIL45716.1 PBP1A family penicillin-binding protein [Vagococcus coleopterorum]
MDIKKILKNIKRKLKKGWQNFKPRFRKFNTKRKHIWRKYQVNKVFVLTVLTITLIGSLYLFYLAKSENVEALKAGINQVTTVYDINDEEAGGLYSQKGTAVELNAMSPYLVDALVSTEDRRFYEHRGFDIRGIGRAAVGFFTAGRITGGGSTITQQLAKNAYLTLDQTLKRKAKELFLAIELEKEYSKDEIMEMYLNNSYFGNSVWGVEDASHKYFAKSAKDLTVDEAAVLIGMLKGPSIYNPIDNFELAKDRRDVVLSVMVDNGKLDKASAEKMQADELYLSDNYTDTKKGYQYMDYFDSVIDEAYKLYGIKDSDLLSKGYKIYTSLDQNYQKAMDTSFKQDYLFPPDAADGVKVQGASVAINPQTGGVMGVMGGRGERASRGLNRATNSRLSPGSTMKPLAVYTSALEEGYRSTDDLKDEKLSFYDVENYDHTFRGTVPMYKALEESLNAPAVWLFDKIGMDKGFDKVEKFGLDLEKDDRYPGLVLGGMTKGTTPLKMASAYTVFANQGVKKDPHFITKIVDATGTVIVDNEDAKSVEVTTPEVAEEMTGMLLGVFSSGTGVPAKPAGFKMAGKTGTTESVMAEEQAKDQWVIGYTPDVVLATWIGFDQSSENHFLQPQAVAPVFKDQAERILPNTPNTQFGVRDIGLDKKVEEEAKEQAEDLLGELSDFGGKIREGADYWGEKLKDGAKNMKDSLGGLTDRLSGYWN